MGFTNTFRIVHFVNEIRLRMRVNDLSIETARQAEIANMDAVELLALRNACLELIPWLETEIMHKQNLLERRNSFGTVGGCERHNKVNCQRCDLESTYYMEGGC